MLTTRATLNKDLNRINNWYFEWKISFNPDPNKQAQEVLFSRKIQKSSQPLLTFNNYIATQSITQKHLQMFFYTKLDFQEHLRSYSVNLIRHLVYYGSSITCYQDYFYKSFIRPHLDYGDTIYDQTYNSSFRQKLDSIQYNTALAITGAIGRTSKVKLYSELGFEALEKR